MLKKGNNKNTHTEGNVEDNGEREREASAQSVDEVNEGKHQKEKAINNQN